MESCWYCTKLSSGSDEEICDKCWKWCRLQHVKTGELPIDLYGPGYMTAESIPIPQEYKTEIANCQARRTEKPLTSYRNFAWRMGSTPSNVMYGRTTLPPHHKMYAQLQERGSLPFNWTPESNYNLDKCWEE